MNDIILKVQNLSQNYVIKKSTLSQKKIIKAVNNVNFEVQRGEVLGFVGGSGCGKTTVAKLIMKIEQASSGNILFNNKNISSLDKKELLKYRSDVQIIFQDTYSALNPRWYIGKIIAEPLIWNSSFSKKEIKEKVLILMQKVGLKKECYDKYPHQFSGGERQRIGIARALIIQPKLIICDEPVSALDVSIQAQVLNLLLSIQKEFNLTYIFISHDLNIISRIANRILVMNEGKVIEINETKSIMTNPQHEYTKKLFKSMPKIKYNLIKNN
jgi:ABC-type oligopeptide transport system ATPase subunit